MKTIEVCLSPSLIGQFSFENKIAVIVDIFRATSCIITGIAHGVSKIVPVKTTEEAFLMGKKGYVMAGERGGKKVQGFDMGNSPFEYMNENIVGKKVVIASTNGSKTILLSAKAHQILIGSFLNFQATVSYLSQKHQNILIHCAGWKGSINIEDSLYAGALIHALSSQYTKSNDSAILAADFFDQNKNNIRDVALQSSHAQRLSGFGVAQDIDFCLQYNIYNTLVEYRKGCLQKVSD